MGLRRKEGDPTFLSHEDYFDSLADDEDENSGYDIAVIENVTEYQEKTVGSRLPKNWTLMSCRLDPRCLGFGAARPGSASFHCTGRAAFHDTARSRLFIVAYNETRVQWVAPWTLKSFMMASRSVPKLSAGDYYHMQLPKTPLSSSNATHINLTSPIKQWIYDESMSRGCHCLHSYLWFS